jgi:hypothetical protein
MKIRLISLALLLTFAGSALAGVPLHSNEQSCPMGMMGDMDCCKAALSRNNTPQVVNARLCCALNCSEEGTTPANGVQVQPKIQPLVLAHVLGAQAILPNVPLLRYNGYSHGPPTDSHPAYIRHLALLI